MGQGNARQGGGGRPRPTDRNAKARVMVYGRALMRRTESVHRADFYRLSRWQGRDRAPRVRGLDGVERRTAELGERRQRRLARAAAQAYEAEHAAQAYEAEHGRPAFAANLIAGEPAIKLTAKQAIPRS